MSGGLGDFLTDPDEWARNGAAFGGVVGLGVLLATGVESGP